MGMYESPIELLITDIQNQIVKQQDEEIYQAVLHFIPNVDKNELIRALKYDRDQYEKGYADGKADAMAEVVLCKDCKHHIRYHSLGVTNCDLHKGLVLTRDDTYCCYGERRTDERKAD